MVIGRTREIERGPCPPSGFPESLPSCDPSWQRMVNLEAEPTEPTLAMHIYRLNLPKGSILGRTAHCAGVQVSRDPILGLLCLGVNLLHGRYSFRHTRCFGWGSCCVLHASTTYM